MKKLLCALILFSGCIKNTFPTNEIIHEGVLEAVEYEEVKWYQDYTHAIIHLKDGGQFKAYFPGYLNVGAAGKKYRYIQFEYGYLKEVEEIQ